MQVFLWTASSYISTKFVTLIGGTVFMWLGVIGTAWITASNVTSFSVDGGSNGGNRGASETPAHWMLPCDKVSIAPNVMSIGRFESKIWFI